MENWLKICGVLTGIFAFLETTARINTKEDYVELIRSPMPHNWADRVGLSAIDTYDSIFLTKKSKKKFGAYINIPKYSISFLCSFVFLIAAILLWVSLLPSYLEIQIHNGTWIRIVNQNSNFGVQFNVVMLLVLSGLVNFLGDYVSLIESRILLELKKNGKIGLVSLIFYDFVLSLLLFGACTVLAVLFCRMFLNFPDPSVFSFQADPDILREYSKNPVVHVILESWRVIIALWEIIIEKDVGPQHYLYGIGICFFVTSLMTSIWVWLYCCAILCGRLAVRVVSALSFVDRWLLFERAPFIVTGGLTTVIWSVPYWGIRVLLI